MKNLRLDNGQIVPGKKITIVDTDGQKHEFWQVEFDADPKALVKDRRGHKLAKLLTKKLS